MSGRKKSTSSEESSSGSSTESTSSSGSESGSDTGSSGSESDSSSSTDHGKQLPTTTNTTSRLQNTNSTTTTTTTNNNSKSTTAAFRRKSSETKQQQQKPIPDEKIKESIVNTKAKSTVNRGQRLSKSSVYSSDEENNTVKKTLTTKPAPNQGHKKNAQNDNKKPIVPPVANTSSGGKAPPAIVKQQQQHGSTKISTKQQQQQHSEIKSKHKNQINEKNKSIFSPDNSSDSDEKEKFNEKPTPKTAPLVKQLKNQQSQPAVVKAKPKPNIRKPSVSQTLKKNDRKRSISTDTASSTDDESSTNSSTHSDDDDDDDSDSSSHSSPPNKKPTTTLLGTHKKQSNLTATTTTASSVLKQIVNKSNNNNNTKTVILSDSDNQGTTIAPVRKQQQTIRKLTRSSSTRKSKHLTGKQSDTDSDTELNKSRSISKSPVKKSSVNIVTKSKTKVKKSEIILTNSLIRTSSTTNNNNSTIGNDVISPIPEIQKCPIEGCDSSGHLSGNNSKHFLPEACPIFHNMSTSECKDRTIDRKLREDEQSKIIAHYDAQKIKIPTSEQKVYLGKIRDARARFKPLIPFPMATTANDKTKNLKHIILDRKREPNLIGLVSDYDLQLFREAQAIASEKIEKEFKELPVGKGIKYILMGKHQMKVWYQSPYPEDVARIPKMYICEFCLRYQKSEISMKRHSSKCVWRHPPGDEIYRKGKLQVWQVDGKKYKQFCQHLCLLAKFFLDHKTLYYEVEPFLFYVMTLANYEGCHIVGYFSKEKNSYLNYNVSCILTLPPYQRKGYGRLLIDFSYLLTRVENKIGSPEKPLSDLGLISYRSYWKDVLLDFLCTRTGTTLSIKDLSQEMAINSYDIVSTLQALGMMKYWKGKHIVLKKQDVLEEYEERIKRRGNFPKIDASCLRWNPFIPPQTCGST